MFVDITDLVHDTGVPTTIDFIPKNTVIDTGDYGVVISPTDDSKKIKNVQCIMVSQQTKGISPQDGSYLSRTTYDFYLPATIFKDIELEGCKIISGRESYVITEVQINTSYVSHIVVNATKEVMDYAKL